MADPFTPPKAPAVSGVDPYLSSPRSDSGPSTMPNRVQRDPSSGFGAGMLVAAVFVVVAILAAMVYSNREYFTPAADDTSGGTSTVTIGNGTAPAAAPAADTGSTTAPATPDTQSGTAPATDQSQQPAADPAAPAPGATTPPAAQPAAPANP